MEEITKKCCCYTCGICASSLYIELIKVRYTKKDEFKWQWVCLRHLTKPLKCAECGDYLSNKATLGLGNIMVALPTVCGVHEEYIRLSPICCTTGCNTPIAITDPLSRPFCTTCKTNIVGDFNVVYYGPLQPDIYDVVFPELLGYDLCHIKQCTEKRIEQGRYCEKHNREVGMYAIRHQPIVPLTPLPEPSGKKRKINSQTGSNTPTDSTDS
jgi:hypothetical protein